MSEPTRTRPCRRCVTPIMRAELEGRRPPECPHTNTEPDTQQTPPIALNDEQALISIIERAFGQKVNTTGSF